MTDLQLMILDNTNAFLVRVMEETNTGFYELACETPSDRYEETTIDGISVLYKLAYGEGGGEGEGDYVERVLEFRIDQQVTFVRATGCYDSYNGTEWNADWTVVYPREVVVTQYFDTP